jgi:2-iminobutanoate/2-iminopropanoate deaminase
MAREVIEAGPGISKPLGPFSRGVRVSDWLYVSGQTGVDPATGLLVPGGAAAETAQIIDNLKAVLLAASADVSHVVKANVFLCDMADFEAMNRVYAAAFTRPYPTRTTVAVKALPGGAIVEIDLVAHLGD